jgi:hypothetical protein
MSRGPEAKICDAECDEHEEGSQPGPDGSLAVNREAEPKEKCA